ncbi:MAG: 50S ribosome-binding GTPase, partial [Deltaproteobacteria bacterium]|nr:50S ribosome-binding GTPase [Deltaproteobacteria bacterium]
MPANLPPQYFEAEKKYRQAKKPPEKMIALETMLAIMPKHKGTDKLRADLRRRLSQLRDESLRKTGGRRSQLFDLDKTGAGQVVLVGFPNVGKSQIVSSLTQAKPGVGEYPYTTRLPLPGMMEYENIQVQLVDIPSVLDESAKAWLMNVVRNADALLLIIDLADDPETQGEILLEELQKYKVRSEETMSSEELGFVTKKMLVVGNKLDADKAEKNYRRLRDKFSKINSLAVSAVKGENMENLRREIFKLLQLVRVYPKTPGKEPDLKNPVILKKGSTVIDFAFQIHKDFVRKLRYARIWGSEKYRG